MLLEHNKYQEGKWKNDDDARRNIRRATGDVFVALGGGNLEKGSLLLGKRVVWLYTNEELFQVVAPRQTFPLWLDCLSAVFSVV